MNEPQLKALCAHLSSRRDLFGQINPNCPELVEVFLEGLAWQLCRSVYRAASGDKIAYTLILLQEVFTHLNTGLAYELGTSLSILVQIIQPGIKMTQLYPGQFPTYDFGAAVFFYRLRTGFVSLYVGLDPRIVVSNEF